MVGWPQPGGYTMYSLDFPTFGAGKPVPVLFLSLMIRNDLTYSAGGLSTLTARTAEEVNRFCFHFFTSQSKHFVSISINFVFLCFIKQAVCSIPIDFVFLNNTSNTGGSLRMAGLQPGHWEIARDFFAGKVGDSIMAFGFAPGALYTGALRVGSALHWRFAPGVAAAPN